VAAARNRVTGSTAPGDSAYAALPVLPMGAATTAYFVHVRVSDRPGVLAAVAGSFAEHGASIRSMTQRGEGAQAELLILTHPGRESDLADTVATLRTLPMVDAVLGVMRVIGEGR
jgi:homoserine dehydrogenase